METLLTFTPHLRAIKLVIVQSLNGNKEDLNGNKIDVYTCNRTIFEWKLASTGINGIPLVSCNRTIFEWKQNDRIAESAELKLVIVQSLNGNSLTERDNTYVIVL